MQGFRIVNQSLEKPWGGFYVLDEGQAEKFESKNFSSGSRKAIILAVSFSSGGDLEIGRRYSWYYYK